MNRPIHLALYDRSIPTSDILARQLASRIEAEQRTESISIFDTPCGAEPLGRSVFREEKRRYLIANYACRRTSKIYRMVS